MFKRLSTPFLGFLQATGLVFYLFILSTFMGRLEHIFDNSTGEYFAPIIMLLLFIISAVISASLVLGRSAMLFWDKKYKEAFTLLAWTIGSGIFYFLYLITILYIFK